MNKTSPPVKVGAVGPTIEGTMIRRFRIDEPGEYELTLDRYDGEVTATFAPAPPVVLTEASLALDPIYAGTNATGATDQADLAAAGEWDAVTAGAGPSRFMVV